jgi:PAS domain S-box-containing protein
VLRDGLVVGLANHTLLIDRDGTERPIADSGAPIFNEHGKVTGVVLVFRDQTEERAREKERSLLSGTISASVNEIYIFDAASLLFRYVNHGALQNLGFSMEEMQTKTPLDLKLEIGPDEFQRILQPLIDQEKAVQVFETVHQRADGSLYPVEVRLQLFDHEGDRVFLAVIQDITERKQAEIKLNEQLEELSRWHAAMLGREERILELKREVNHLLENTGQPPRYASPSGAAAEPGEEKANE